MLKKRSRDKNFALGEDYAFVSFLPEDAEGCAGEGDRCWFVVESPDFSEKRTHELLSQFVVAGSESFAGDHNGIRH